MEERSLVSGKTVLYALVGVGAIIYYGQVGCNLIGEYYFGHSLPASFHYAVIALISTLTMMAIGCSVHLQSIGGFEKGELKRELAKGLDELKYVKETGEKAINQLEELLPRHAGGLSSRAEEALRILRQILHSVDARIDSVERLKSVGKLAELCTAVDILRKKLRSSESPRDHLIDVDPFPAIPAHQITETVDRLVNELSRGFRKAA
jgi:hypothetical protein